MTPSTPDPAELAKLLKDLGRKLKLAKKLGPTIELRTEVFEDLLSRIRELEQERDRAALEEREACAMLCDGAASEADFIAASQLNWNEAQRPEGAAGGARRCAESIRLRDGGESTVRRDIIEELIRELDMMPNDGHEFVDPEDAYDAALEEAIARLRRRDRSRSAAKPGEPK